MQKISSYKTIFYDMDGKEIEIDLPEWAYESLDEAISLWENGER
jgi:hypothetical protein